MTVAPGTGSAVRRLPMGVVWTVTIMLIVIGVGAAIGRGVFPGDFLSRAEPVRQRTMDALDRNDPFASTRSAEVAAVDGRFGAHPVMTLLHVLPGGLFLLLASLQFSARIRRRHVHVHRWSGRLLLVAATVGVITGLYFGVVIPYAGWGETMAIVLFGGLLLVAIGRGYIAIRRKEVARHREWMIRVFALALAISTVRIVAVVLDVALTPAGWSSRQIFVASLWAGWIITLAAAEGWIRQTRN